MRVVFVGNLRLRGYGDIGFNADRRMLHGLIKTGHRIHEFSDRDIAHLDNPLGLKPIGAALANRRLIEMCGHVEPDLLILGLCDIIRNETILEIRRRWPALHVAHWNVDALFFPATVEKIRARAEVVHSLFLTTGGPPLRALAAPGRLAAYIPNPTDPGADDLDNSHAGPFEHDLLYLGVGNPSDERWKLVSTLQGNLAGLRFSVFGSHGGTKVFGRARDRVLAVTRMALNLNRIEGDPLYSSDRIAMLMPNGIVTFISARSGLQRFFSGEEAVFFEDADDIAREARALIADDDRRRAIAAAGRAKYRGLFDGHRVGAYLIETALGLRYSMDYPWADEIARS